MPTLADAFDAACLALVNDGVVPDTLWMPSATYASRQDDLIEACGDPPTNYMYLGSVQVGLSYDDHMADNTFRVEGAKRVSQLVVEG